MQQRSADMARYEADKIDFAKRLNEALEAKGFPQHGRATKLRSLLRDPPSRVAISKWLAGDSLPEVKRLGEISQIIGKSVQWMLTGEDSQEQADGYSERPIMIPIVTWEQAAAIRPGDILSLDVDQRILSPVIVGANAYAVRVKGDAMTSRDGGRSYPDGMVLIVDPDKLPESGNRVIARIAGDELTFKELVRDAGEWYLKPINPQYRTVPLSDETVIVGVVRCSIQEE